MKEVAQVGDALVGQGPVVVAPRELLRHVAARLEALSAHSTQSGRPVAEDSVSDVQAAVGTGADRLAAGVGR